MLETIDPSPSDVDDLPGMDDPSDLLIEKEKRKEILSFLAALPELQRSVLLLHYIEDFSLEEIAKITGSTPGTVKSRLHYGRKALRQRIEEQTS